MKGGSLVSTNCICFGNRTGNSRFYCLLGSAALRFLFYVLHRKGFLLREKREKDLSYALPSTTSATTNYGSASNNNRGNPPFHVIGFPAEQWSRYCLLVGPPFPKEGFVCFFRFVPALERILRTMDSGLVYGAVA